MNTIHRSEAKCRGIKFSLKDGGREVARAYLYVMENSLHDRLFGLMEDVFVDESCRGQGLGTELVCEVVRAAREVGCYKLIATSRDSRPRVHRLYESLGFASHGREFRMDFR